MGVIVKRHFGAEDPQLIGMESYLHAYPHHL